MYLPIHRIVLHIEATNGSITLIVSKLVMLGKTIHRFLGWVSKLLVKSITGNVSLGKIVLSEIILDRFRISTVFLGNIALI